MKPTLILEGDGGTIALEPVNPNGWSYCYLEDGGRRTFLGADDIDHILSRLLGILGEEDELAPATGQYNGYSVRCSLILSEVHHVLYVADQNGERILLGKTLTIPCCRLSALSSFLPNSGISGWHRLRKSAQTAGLLFRAAVT